MKLYLAVIAVSLFTSTMYCQGMVSAEDKALLDQLRYDHSFFEVDRDESEWLYETNTPKWTLYRAFHEKTPTTVKVRLRKRAGWEGQYTITWFTVASGKATIVEAYFGDPSGSDELQSVRTYTPDKLVLGTYDRHWKCVPTTRFGDSKTAELCLLYNVPAGTTMKVF